MQATIRKGIESDLEHVLLLIVELAVYEKAPNAVTNTLEKMKEDGFGKNPVFGFFIAELKEEIVGISLYYTRYSTWKGRCLYLEDIIVTERYRNNGIGGLLFEETKRFAIENNFISLNWQVLNWNKPAIHFYKKYHATFDEEWTNCSVVF
jgi:GNAT superfamily N-acetyltransferase